MSNERAMRFPLKRYTSLDAMKADEYRYWQEQPAQKRAEATAQLSADGYNKGRQSRHVPRLQRPLVRLER
jgi:hypothetical protein